MACLELRNKGLVLVETFVAIFIFGLIAMAGTLAIMNAYKMLEFSRIASKGAVAATTVLEKLRKMPINNLQDSTEEITVGGKNFVAITTLCPANSVCNDQTKTLNLQVFYNTKNVYEMQFTLTALR